MNKNEWFEFCGWVIVLVVIGTLFAVTYVPEPNRTQKPTSSQPEEEISPAIKYYYYIQFFTR